jgi:hypothetical protein
MPLLMELSSDELQLHLAEIADESANILYYCERLRQADLPEDERDRFEGDLYVALEHLRNHVGPALDEWDRMIDALPEDDE